MYTTPSASKQIQMHVMAMAIEMVKLHRCYWKFHFAGISRAIRGV